MRRGRRGFVLITAAITAVILLGILGLAVDLARMYITRNELQAFTDGSSIAAAFELDGTQAGLDHARTVATNYPNKWNFQLASPQNITVTFASAAGGPYVAVPASASGVKFVRVNADGLVTLYFLPGYSQMPAPGMLLWAISRQQLLNAVATSGQFGINSFRENLLPYSPDSPNPADPNWGFTPGKMFTLRWPPPGQRDQKNDWCDGDEVLNFQSPSSAAQRGFIDIGEGAGGNGSAFIRDAIVNNVQTHPLAVGDQIIGAPGNRGTESDALRERYGQDADSTSQTYAEYMAKINDPSYVGPLGNGRRFVVVPINDPATDTVLGFAGFFLHQDVCSVGGDSLLGNGNQGNAQGGGNVQTCCAEYVGPALVPGRKATGPNAGAFRVKLFQ